MKLKAYEIELYAVNTGELYETHKKLGKCNAGVSEWRRHIIGTVLPLYRKEIDSAAWIAAPVTFEAAQNLKDYYDQHAKELVNTSCEEK